MPPGRKPTKKNQKKQRIAEQRFDGLLHEFNSFKASFPDKLVAAHENALRAELNSRNPDFAKSSASVKFLGAALISLEKVSKKAELAITAFEQAGHPQDRKSLEIAQMLRSQIFHTQELLQKISAKSKAVLN